MCLFPASKNHGQEHEAAKKYNEIGIILNNSNNMFDIYSLI